MSLVFDPEGLPKSMAIWHSRLMEVISETYGAINPDVNADASSGDLYLIARRVGSYCQSLRMAYRVTKDPALLAEAVRVMILARSSLDDYDDDGYLEWVHDYGDGPSDDNMDRGLAWMQTAAHVAWLANKPDYASEYATWLDILENQFLPQGYNYSAFVHMALHLARWMLFAEMLGIDSGFGYTLHWWIDKCLMPPMLIDSGGAYVWDMRQMVPAPADKLFAMPTGYAQEVFASILELYMANVSPFCGHSFMARWMKTARDNILADGIEHMRGDVTGGTGYSWIDPYTDDSLSSDKYLIWAMAGFTAWDDTGTIESINESVWQSKPRRSAQLPAYALVGAGIRYINENAGARPWLT